jgi:DNA helicase-2/ATP-dependent DNA helicase PcrA
VAAAGASTRRPVDLAGLNERQREAVLHRGAPLLILAGAGSGKTRVITTKVAHLITTGAVSATHILAVTFTNKAADEMRTRVRRLVAECGRGDTGSRVMVRTFHAFGSWLLRVHGERLGFDPARLSIFDDSDVRQILSQVAAGDADEYLASDIREIAAWIATAKNRGIAPDGDLSEMRRTPFPMERLYARYQRRLAELNGVDFGDLILLPATLLRRDAEVRKTVHERFRVLLVDEFQDANQAQFELLRVLHRPGGYLCVVGDDDQSIYRFRGADVDGFLTFPERFAGTEVVRLEQNYRSTGAILDLASAVVSHNRRRMGKTLWTDQDQGELPTVAYLADAEEEARYCAELVRQSRGSTAILYRMNFQSRTFETLFQALRIPYRVVGTVRFYEREEIKDALAYLSLLYNPRDEVAFRRAASKPRRGIGPKTATRVAGHAPAAGGDLIAAAAALAAAGRGSARAALAEFAALLSDLREVHEHGTVTDLLRAVLDRSGLYASVLAQDQEERTGRTMNLDELVAATAAFGSGPAGLAEFLETARLAGVSEQQDGQGEPDEAVPDATPPVTLITAHNTKGLEFDQVIVTGLEEGIFPAGEPSAPRLAAAPEEEEEERRLFYVAVTRARFTLHLTACRRRMAFGFAREREPSRFVTEIPPELVRVAGGGGDTAEPGALREGQGVSHIDYGIGVVERRWMKEGETMLRVRFQSGRTATFFAAYADLDPVAGDDW